MHVLLNMRDHDLAFPLAELELAIAFAKLEVHNSLAFETF
jgi:hypothetical protein